MPRWRAGAGPPTGASPTPSAITIRKASIGSDDGAGNRRSQASGLGPQNCLKRQDAKNARSGPSTIRIRIFGVLASWRFIFRPDAQGPQFGPTPVVYGAAGVVPVTASDKQLPSNASPAK